MVINSNENGSCIISTKAFKDIAEIVCKDIKDIYPAKKDGGFATCLVSNKGDVKISISIKIKQGVDVVKVCGKIQDSINENILLMTGIDCNNININIQGFVSK